MKMIFCFCLLVLALACTSPLYATIIRVNNNLATNIAQKIYNKLQEAHDDGTNVKAGDTLMVEGSGKTYDVLTCSKRLVIIGPGYLLDANPQTQANLLPAVVSHITLEPAAEGTVLMGLTFDGGSNNQFPSVAANNITVMHCFLQYGVEIKGQISNLRVLQNYFPSSYNVEYYSNTSTATGVILGNNLITGEISIESTASHPRVFTSVENNIFLDDVVLTTATLRSNIIATQNAKVTITSSNVQNNLVSNNQIPAGNGNQTYDPTKLFVGAAGNSPDGQYKLKPDSPYQTAGFGGTQPGIFGGSVPYVLSGMPPLPAIYYLQTSGMGNPQNGLLIHIKVKSY